MLKVIIIKENNREKSFSCDDIQSFDLGNQVVFPRHRNAKTLVLMT